MIIFQTIFAIMMVVGALMGAYGGALLALAMIFFCKWAKKKFDEQDKAYNESPERATKPDDTMALLDQKGCEASVDKLPGQIFKSDSEI